MSVSLSLFTKIGEAVITLLTFLASTSTLNTTVAPAFVRVFSSPFALTSMEAVPAFTAVIVLPSSLMNSAPLFTVISIYFSSMFDWIVKVSVVLSFVESLITPCLASSAGVHGIPVIELPDTEKLPSDFPRDFSAPSNTSTFATFTGSEVMTTFTSTPSIALMLAVVSAATPKVTFAFPGVTLPCASSFALMEPSFPTTISPVDVNATAFPFEEVTFI